MGIGLSWVFLPKCSFIFFKISAVGLSKFTVNCTKFKKRFSPAFPVAEVPVKRIESKENFGFPSVSVANEILLGAK